MQPARRQRLAAQPSRRIRGVMWKDIRRDLRLGRAANAGLEIALGIEAEKSTALRGQEAGAAWTGTRENFGRVLELHPTAAAEAFGPPRAARRALHHGSAGESGELCDAFTARVLGRRREESPGRAEGDGLCARATAADFEGDQLLAIGRGETLQGLVRPTFESSLVSAPRSKPGRALGRVESSVSAPRAGRSSRRVLLARTPHRS